MGRQSLAETRFRERVRQERERRKLSQADLSKVLQDKGLEHIYPTTVAKIESGERSVRIDEAAAIADLFQVSVDTLMGRSVGLENDLAYTLRAVMETVRQSTYQVSGVTTALAERVRDLTALDFEGRDAVLHDVSKAATHLETAKAFLQNVSEFELPPDANVTLREVLVTKEARRLVDDFLDQEDE